MKRLRPAVFLDRDGIINVDKAYLYRIEEFEYLEGAVEGLKQLQEWGYLLVIITNQSGIARGYYTEEDFHRLTDWMLTDLKRNDVNIDGVYYCPHHPESKIGKYRKTCNCRKPKTAMFYQAAEDLGIDFAQSVAIGDKTRDLEICSETKARGILLSESYKGVGRVIACRNWKQIISSIERLRLYGNG